MINPASSDFRVKLAVEVNSRINRISLTRSTTYDIYYKCYR
jgi:hypothetical protein